ncbi:hypothetical protein BKA61DRAFT_680460 [Leptodontidium sp. MPI-SDFR-AT-0119]|nr:hypothetical protein BKA61DRAFT_680460 [Leptodontidium sp. MPI-SDFR-AT-0119]
MSKSSKKRYSGGENDYVKLGTIFSIFCFTPPTRVVPDDYAQHDPSSSQGGKRNPLVLRSSSIRLQDRTSRLVPGPNVFTSFILGPTAELVKGFRKTGKQGALRIASSQDAPVGIIDANDVAVFAAHLLVEDDITKHDKAKYVLNGPEDITGRQVVELVEKEIVVGGPADFGDQKHHSVHEAVLELAAPKVTPTEFFKTMLGQGNALVQG